MSQPPRSRTRRSYLIEMICYGVMWVWNLNAVVRHFRTMGLLEGLAAGMLFAIAPIAVWQAFWKAGEAR